MAYVIADIENAGRTFQFLFFQLLLKEGFQLVRDEWLAPTNRIKFRLSIVFLDLLIAKIVEIKEPSKGKILILGLL